MPASYYAEAGRKGASVTNSRFVMAREAQAAPRQNVGIPVAYQELFRPHRYKVTYGGRGSAKSWSYARALLMRAHHEKLLILCAREFQNSIADSVHRLLSTQIDMMGLSPWFDVQQKTIISKVTGSYFIFKGLHNNVAEIKSTEGVDICWVEEAESVTEDSWLVLDPTIRKDNSEIWISFNTLGEHDPTYVRFVLLKTNDAWVQKVSYRDNPCFPDVLERQRLKMQHDDPGNYMWVWEGFPRKINDATIFAKRVVIEPFETPALDVRFFHGADFGFAVDPSTLIRCWIRTNSDGSEDLMIDREAYGFKTEIDALPEMYDTIETSRTWPIKADVARPETISYLARKGFAIDAAEKWPGSVEDGIAHLKGFSHIYIHPDNCPNIAREAYLYSYKVDPRNNQVLPIVVDKYNHGWDACIAEGQRVRTARGQVPIEAVQVGDLVYTRKGLRKVLATRCNGIKPVLRLRVGKDELIATADHLLATPASWTRLGDLRYADGVLRWEPGTWSQLWSSTAGFITAMKAATTFGLVIHNHLIRTCTGLCGSTIAAQFQKVITYTTGTITNSRQLIQEGWSVCLPLCTCPSICNNGALRTASNTTLTSLPSGPLPKRGTLVRKVGKCIAGLEGWLTKTLFHKKSTASSAATHLPVENLATQTSFAPMLAKPRGGVRVVLTTSLERVCTAVGNLFATNTARNCVVAEVVQCIDNGELMRVYDLSIEDQPEFFASNILVHNCRYALDGYIHARGGVGVWMKLGKGHVPGTKHYPTR